MNYNIITGVARPLNTTFPIRMRLTGSAAWNNGALQSDGTYLCMLTSVPAGVYPVGGVEYELIGSNPPIRAYNTTAVTVLNDPAAINRLATPTITTPVTVTSTTATFSWAAIQGADSYAFKLNNGTIYPLGNVLSYVATGLSPSLDVVGAVQAVDSTNTKLASLYSAPVTATTAANTTGPTPIPDAPTNLRQIASTGNTVRLAWDGVAGSYTLQRAPLDGNGNPGTFVPVYTNTAQGFQDSGLAFATSYGYRVQVKVGNVASAFSLVAIATTNATNAATPRIISVSPTILVQGATAKIQGLYLTGTTAVRIGGMAVANFTVDSDTQITVILATTQPTGSLEVEVNGATTTSTFTVTVNASTGNLRAAQAAFGDSLVRGYLTSNEATKNWPQQLYDNFLDKTKFAQPGIFAISNQVTADMLTAQWDNFVAATPALLDNFQQLIANIGGGINDIMYLGAQALTVVKANKIELIRRIRGWGAANNRPIKIVLESITRNGYQYGITSLADCEAMRNQINADAILTYRTEYDADYYCNYNADDRMSDYTDADYFTPDREHFTDLGQLARAQDELDYYIAAQQGTYLEPKPDMPIVVNSTAAAAGGSATKLIWVEADRQVKHQGQTVLEWGDMGSLSDTLVSAGYAAHYRENVANGYPAIRLKNQVMRGHLNSFSNMNEPFQLLMVVRVPSNQDTNMYLAGLGGPYTSEGCTLNLTSYGGKCILFSGADDNRNVAPAMVYDRFVLIGGRYGPSTATGASGPVLTYVNGAVSSPRNLWLNTYAPTPLAIGCDGSFGYTGDGLFDGDFEVAAVIAEKSNSDATWNANVQYLNQKYALY
jgi:lysophospholipase L1-like esterase